MLYSDKLIILSVNLLFMMTKMIDINLLLKILACMPSISLIILYRHCAKILKKKKQSTDSMECQSALKLRNNNYNITHANRQCIERSYFAVVFVLFIIIMYNY